MRPSADDLASFRESQRRWLRKLGILDRPWLILGAAPEPTIPEGMLTTHARIDINNAGLTAQAMGLGPADLTFRKKSKPWAEHPTLETRGLIWYHRSPLLFLRLQLMTMPKVRVGSIMRVARSERDAIVDLIAGTPLRGMGDTGKATNGVAAACYALFVGVPEIVLSGLSLSKQGHSYNELGRIRKQVSEDALVLQRLSARADVFTTERDLAEASGIRLMDSGAR